ncbi:MAG: hypothetical protein AABZ30_09120 [Myxococcota bacterium]
MRIVQILVYGSILLILAMGGGWVAARIGGRPDLCVFFGTWLLRALYVAGVALIVALVVGLYHLYLYLFTDRRPLGFFVTTDKDDPGEQP